MLLNVDPQQYTQIPVPLKIIKLLIKELVPTNDTSAIQQGVHAAGGSVASEDEWEDDLEDIGFLGTKKGEYSFFLKAGVVTYDILIDAVPPELAAFGEEGSNRGRIRDDETNVSFDSPCRWFFFQLGIWTDGYGTGTPPQFLQGHLHKQYRKLPGCFRPPYRRGEISAVAARVELDIRIRGHSRCVLNFCFARFAIKRRIGGSCSWYAGCSIVNFFLSVLIFCVLCFVFCVLCYV